MFFATRARGSQLSVLSDCNAELMTTYRAVANEPDEVLQHLRAFERVHNRETYLDVRRNFNAHRAWMTDAELGATFIYLNKTCFNGVYRVNASGDFNVPMGRYTNPTIADEPAIRAASAMLSRGAHLLTLNYADAIELCQQGDFVYLDPPYAPVSDTANFTGYASGGFSAADHGKLREVFGELDRRGCKVLLTNSAAPLVFALYRGYRTVPFSAARSINSKAKRRGPVTELAILNYE